MLGRTNFPYVVTLKVKKKLGLRSVRDGRLAVTSVCFKAKNAIQAGSKKLELKILSLTGMWRPKAEGRRPTF